jgi:protoheme IX farnesyltransferase
MKTALRVMSAPQSGSFMLKLRAYWLLSKPRVTILVWLTTAFGLMLGGWGQVLQNELIVATLIGSWLVVASANALNQAIEWARDAQMPRTALRPIPSGMLSPLEGWLVGTLWGVLGVLTLALWVNGAVAWLGAVSILLYAFVYTPLKPQTHFSTAIGAIPGAIPPMAGWVAAQGGFSLEAWLLFALQFVWQFPHFWAIAWLYRDDYARAGFRMLPYPDASAVATARLSLAYTLAMVAISLMFALPAGRADAGVLGDLRCRSLPALARPDAGRPRCAAQLGTVSAAAAAVDDSDSLGGRDDEAEDACASARARGWRRECAPPLSRRRRRGARAAV